MTGKGFVEALEEMEGLTAVEVAEIFGVSTQTVMTWRRLGSIPYVERKLPGQKRGRYRYPEREIRRLAKAKAVGFQAVSSE